jgi:hypothetical protein
MKAVALAVATVLWQLIPVVQPDRLRYERAITVPAGAREACAVLDGAIFPHAAPSLRDMRILPVQDGEFGPAREIPYALTMSEAMTEATEPARALNLDSGAGHGIVFDLEMPQRNYTNVILDLDPAMRDFIATATVSGSDSLGNGAKSKALGAFTLFDLSSQHLSRDTTLPLEESAFRYLHVMLSVASAPGGLAAGFPPAMVRGADVPPSREAQTVYNTVAETSAITTVGRESRAEFVIPRRVPVERVSFVLEPEFKGNFSREVRVTAIADTKPAADHGEDGEFDTDQRAPLPEVVTGAIQRVHTTEAGRELGAERLSVPAILGANLQRAAKVEVAIENGDDPPLPIAGVRLEMRQRKLCFDATASADGRLALYYGDPQLPPPVNGYEPFMATREAAVAELGPEQVNPEFRAPEAEPPPMLQRHPEVLWMVLIAVACAIGMVGLRTRST